MIQAAGITLRETVEAILVVSVMLAYLKKTGRAEMGKYVYYGSFSAVGASVLFAVGLAALGISPENELFEGVMLIAGGVFVGSLVVWMWKKAKTIKEDVEKKVEKAVSEESSFSLSSGLGLAAIAFLFVFREGAETVIFLQSLALEGVSQFSNLLGGILGISLALVFGVVFLRGVARINLGRFFKVTSGILSVLVASLIFSGLHEFFVVGILPTSNMALRIVGFMARTSTSVVLIAGMIVALVGMALYDVLKASKPSVKGLSGAEKRKKLHEFRKEKYIKIGTGILLLVLVPVLMAPAVTARYDYSDPEPQKVTTAGGTISVDIAGLEDGFYKYYYEKDGQRYRFMMFLNDGEPKLALDACYICPPLGYGHAKKKGVLVCYNCEAPINVETLGSPGGCNPVAFPFEQDGEMVKVRPDDLVSTWESHVG